MTCKWNFEYNNNNNNKEIIKKKTSKNKNTSLYKTSILNSINIFETPRTLFPLKKIKENPVLSVSYDRRGS